MTADNNKAKAVVVNDDVTQLNILSRLLRKDGISAMAFSSAEDALSSMNPSTPPDPIITDVYMPGIDGRRFCRLLRRKGVKSLIGLSVI